MPVSGWLLGLTSAAIAVALLGVELRRVWKLGALAERHGEGAERWWLRWRRMARIAREGYAVSRIQHSATFNMLVAFAVTLGLSRALTLIIHTRGALGPVRNVRFGTRHIHHYVPGFLLCSVSGGFALGTRLQAVRGCLALPFGAGVALVLDETALLLRLEDVYWTEEGVLSLQVAFAGMSLLGAVAYAVQFLRRGSSRVREADWAAANRAWDDIGRFAGSN